MPLIGFQTLHQQADEDSPRVPVVAAGGADPTVLIALHAAQHRGWVEPHVTGLRSEIVELGKTLQLDLSAFHIHETQYPAPTAVDLVRTGTACLLMKGQIATPDLMRAVLHRTAGLRTAHTIGQVVLMELLRDRRVLLLTDTGITIQPTLDQKADLLHSLISVARSLMLPSSSAETTAQSLRPKVAIVSATEKVNEAMPDTLDAAELQQRAEAGEFDAEVQGPLSFDLAYASDAGEKKRLSGSVIGAADALLFPNLLAANLTVKAMMYTAECRFGGLLVGTQAPVVFMSRADSVETRLNSLALTLHWLRWQQQKGQHISSRSSAPV